MRGLPRPRVIWLEVTWIKAEKMIRTKPRKNEAVHVEAGKTPVAARDALLDRIRARRKTIQSREGILAESYPMIRADRENR